MNKIAKNVILEMLYNNTDDIQNIIKRLSNNLKFDGTLNKKRVKIENLIKLSINSIEVEDEKLFNDKILSIDFYITLLKAIAVYNSAVLLFHIDKQNPDEAFIKSFSDAYKIYKQPDNIITNACRRLNITQKELAKSMGIGYTTLNRWSRKEVDTPKWAINFISLLLKDDIYRKKDENIKKAIKLLQDI